MEQFCFVYYGDKYTLYVLNLYNMVERNTTVIS